LNHEITINKKKLQDNWGIKRTFFAIIIIMKAEIIVTLYIKNVTGALYTVNYNENRLSVSVNDA